LPGWTGSVEPTMGELVLPLWQLAPRGKDGGYPRSAALPDSPTFEEFYATVKSGTRPSGFTYEVLRAAIDPQVAMFRTALMPPKAPNDLVILMRSAFVELWKDRDFIRDYSNVVKTKPILVTGEEAQAMVAALGNVKPEIKAFLLDYSNRLVRKLSRPAARIDRGCASRGNDANAKVAIANERAPARFCRRGICGARRGLSYTVCEAHPPGRRRERPGRGRAHRGRASRPAVGPTGCDPQSSWSG